MYESRRLPLLTFLCGSLAVVKLTRNSPRYFPPRIPLLDKIKPHFDTITDAIINLFEHQRPKVPVLVTFSGAPVDPIVFSPGGQTLHVLGDVFVARGKNKHMWEPILKKMPCATAEFGRQHRVPRECWTLESLDPPAESLCCADSDCCDCSWLQAVPPSQVRTPTSTPPCLYLQPRR